MRPQKHNDGQENDDLAIHEAALLDLCNTYGTPLFIFNEARLRGNYRAFHDAVCKYLPKNIVSYSIKTNYNLAICKILREEGAYAATASGLDLHIARRVGFPPEHIILDGLFKSQSDLTEAVSLGLFSINVESFSEIETLNTIAGELGKTQDIGIRMNLAKPHGFLNNLTETMFCHPSSRFGFSAESGFSAFERASQMENLRVNGMMTHPCHGAVDSLLLYVRRVQREFGVKIEYVNLGGGFGRNPSINTYDLAVDLLRTKLGFESKLDKKLQIPDTLERVEKTCGEIAKLVRLRLGYAPGPTIVFEPGRFIVGSAGILLVQVKHIKKLNGCKWVIVDAGTNVVPDYWERREIKVLSPDPRLPMETVNLAGPLLYPYDLIVPKKKAPKVREGDILAIRHAGAYTLSQSTQFLYARPAAFLLTLDGQFAKIRERENYEDVLRMDRGV